MSFQIFTALALFAFVSCVTPGPNTMMLLSSGTSYGFARTVPHMLGICFGLVVMMILAGAGLINLFVLFPFAYTVLKVAGISYLLYLAWSIATAIPINTEARREDESGKPISFMQAVLLQWVNPKVMTMALTAVTAFVPKPQTAFGLIMVALIFGLICLPTTIIWTAMGTHIKRLLSTPRHFRIFNAIAAIALVMSLYPIITA